MSNTMYLVCVHHPEPVHAFVLADRVGGPPYELAIGELAPKVAQHFARSLEKFLETHKLCGGGFDHFTIAYAQSKDYDLPNPAPVADVVHLALREAANGHDAVAKASP